MTSKSVPSDTPTDAPGSSPSPTSTLPLTRDLKRAYQLSILIAVLTALASLAGLLFPETLYPSTVLRQSSLPNDLINLVIGLPILLITMWLARRGSLVGLLFWPGALFYGLYNYLIYTFSVPFSTQFLAYLAIVVLSAGAILSIIASIDAPAVKQQLEGQVFERWAGGFLFLFGALFLIRSIATFAGTLSSQAGISRPEAGLLLADMMLSIPWIVAGILLWRRQAPGYVWGAALLFQAGALFIGLITLLIAQPLLTEAPIVVEDLIVIGVMSLVCFVPFGLFLRGMMRSSRSP